VRLRRFNEFTDSQLSDIAIAATTNTQIFWIADDLDIRNYLLNIFRSRWARLPANIQTDFVAATGIDPSAAP
jgi:hypothetical protein